MKNSKKKSPLFKVILKPNPSAQKVIFFLTSYRAPWFIYSLVINTLRRNGYEVVVYDFKDSILDNDDPFVLPAFIEDLCEDMHRRVLSYTEKGITIFDGVGSSLGSFLLYNYCIRYPLRKISLNTVSYMAQVIFTTTDRRMSKTRRSYIAQGYDLHKLAYVWRSIDAPLSGKDLKSESTLIFTALHDKFVTRESAKEVINNVGLSKTHLMVYTNRKLGHRAAILKNVHSKQLLQFLLTN